MISRNSFNKVIIRIHLAALSELKLNEYIYAHYLLIGFKINSVFESLIRDNNLIFKVSNSDKVGNESFVP